MKRVLAIGLLVCSAFPVVVRAQGVDDYDSSHWGDFFFELESYVEHDFWDLQCCSAFTQYEILGGPGWECRITAEDNNCLWEMNGAFSTCYADDSIVIDIEGEAVTAFSGEFWATDVNDNLVPAEMRVRMVLLDGAFHVWRYFIVPDSSADWHGFISDTPFNRIYISVYNPPGLYPTMGSFLMGCTTPRPWGDVTGDGFADIDDTLATLACFGGDCWYCFDSRVNTCDITPCGGDGFSDIDDTLATLAAFGGATDCSDPCG